MAWYLVKLSEHFAFTLPYTQRH